MQRIAAQLTMTLAQAAILCDALKSPPGSVQRVNRQLELARKVETDLLLQFTWHPEPQCLLGADDEVHHLTLCPGMCVPCIPVFFHG